MEVDFFNSSIICRLCGEENSNGTSIFQETNFQTNILSLINKYLPIKVSENDKLPKIICQACTLQLYSTISFLEVVINGQSKLRDIFFEQTAVSNNLLTPSYTSSHLKRPNPSISESLPGEPYPGLDIADSSHEDCTEDKYNMVSPCEVTGMKNRQRSVDHSGCNSNMLSDLGDDIKQIFSLPLDETPLYSESHALSARTVGLTEFTTKDPPKKKRGRPRKDASATSKPAVEKSLLESRNILSPESTKRKRKVPQRYLESVQGVELEKLLDKGEYEVEEFKSKKNHPTDSLQTVNIISIGESLDEGESLMITTGMEAFSIDPNEQIVSADSNIGMPVDNLRTNTNDLLLKTNSTLNEITKTLATSSKLKDDYKVRKRKKKKLYLYCEVCNKSFRQHMKLNMHRQTHNLLYRCHTCSKYFHIYSNLFKHQSEQLHKEYDIVDQNVQDPLPTEDSDTIDSFISQEGDVIKCRHCNKEFLSKIFLAIHIKLILNKERAYPCPLCNQSFEMYSSLRNHIVTDHKPKKTSKQCVCDICNKQFTHPSSVVYHKETVHSNLNYKCPKCDKEFKHKQLLNRHQLVHMETRPFKCSQCSMSFKTNISLNAHMMKHTGAKAHVCEICNKILTHRSSMISHYRWHQGIKPYQCEQCFKAFNQKGNLKEHIRIHTGEKPFSCEMCSKKFTTYSQHALHMKRHTGEKPHRCDMCLKSFLSSESYKCHMRRHKGEKPFFCTFENCNLTFVDCWALKKHIKIHEYNHAKSQSEKSKQGDHQVYSCGICNKTLASLANLIKHKKCHERQDPLKAEDVDYSVMEFFNKNNTKAVPTGRHIPLENESKPQQTQPSSIVVNGTRDADQVFYLYEDSTLLPLEKSLLGQHVKQEKVADQHSFELVSDVSELHLFQVPMDLTSTDQEVGDLIAINEQSTPLVGLPDEATSVLADNREHKVNEANILVNQADNEDGFIDLITEDGDHVRMMGVSYNSLQFLGLEPETMQLS